MKEISAFGIWFAGMLLILAMVVMFSLGIMQFTESLFLFSCVWGIGGYIAVVLIGYFKETKYHWN